MPIGPADSLEAVLIAAQRGDHDGLAELWRRHQHQLLRYLRGRIGPDVAEDVASQVWIEVAHGLGRFDGRGEDSAFRRWLFTIARRRLTDELRRQQRRSEQLTASPREQTVVQANPHDELEAALSLISMLQGDQAEAVLLRVVADLDVAAVAVLMQRSEGSVRVLTHRGLHRLAELLAEAASPTSGNVAEAVTPRPRRTMQRSR